MIDHLVANEWLTQSERSKRFGDSRNVDFSQAPIAARYPRSGLEVSPSTPRALPRPGRIQSPLAAANMARRKPSPWLRDRAGK